MYSCSGEIVKDHTNLQFFVLLAAKILLFGSNIYFFALYYHDKVNKKCYNFVLDLVIHKSIWSQSSSVPKAWRIWELNTYYIYVCHAMMLIFEEKNQKSENYKEVFFSKSNFLVSKFRPLKMNNRVKQSTLFS